MMKVRNFIVMTAFVTVNNQYAAQDITQGITDSVKKTVVDKLTNDNPWQIAENEKKSLIAIFKKAVEAKDHVLFEKLANKYDARYKNSNWRGVIISNYGHDIQALQFLIEKVGIDVNSVQPDDNKTALFDACEKGNPEAIAYLIDKGADVNATTHNPYDSWIKYRPLEIISADYVTSIELLVKHGALCSQNDIRRYCSYTAFSPDVCKALIPILNSDTKEKVKAHLIKEKEQTCSNIFKQTVYSDQCKNIQEKLTMLSDVQSK